MSNITNLDNFEQGRLILQDIENEAIRQLEFFDIPRRVILDTHSFNSLMLVVKPENVGASTLFICGKYDLELVIINCNKSYLYVVGSNEEEFDKFKKTICKD